MLFLTFQMYMRTEFSVQPGKYFGKMFTLNKSYNLISEKDNELKYS